jgi:eukaryotic-like serine/threonine-protein kinase
MPIKVFIGYSHEDQELHKKLREHLIPLERSRKITIWQDQEISAGTNWEREIITHLNEADLILLLVSSSFIASHYCWNTEMQTTLERHNDGTARVIPIILKPALWEDTPLGQLQVLPTGARPVTEWHSQDAALDNVVRGIRDVMRDPRIILGDGALTSPPSTADLSELMTSKPDYPNVGSHSGQTFPLQKNGGASPSTGVQEQTTAITLSASLPNPSPPPETSLVLPPLRKQLLLSVRVSRRQALLAAPLVLLLVLAPPLAWSFLHPAMSSFSLPNTVMAVQAPDGELIGLSDGKYVFDTKSPATDLKKQAAQKLQQGDTGTAISLLSAAHNQETSDAEALIYQENIRVISGGNYITLVVGTTLTGTSKAIALGHEDLQGAYVAQREYNDTADQHGGIKVRLLIANSAGKTDDDTSHYTSLVAQQIVSVAQQDKTIVGVMGWNLSALSFAAITPLTQAHIPMVSIAAADNLTKISKYFFRANAPAAVQAKVAAQYSLQTMKATSVAIFVATANDYSRSLADDFKANFVGNGGTTVATEEYTVGDADTQPARLETKLQDALQHHPDIIYFAGYPADVSILLQHLQPSDPPVVGGSALYKLGSYTYVTHAGLSHLHISALAYPDEWDILCSSGLSQACSKPLFFTDYPQAFDDGKHQQAPYGYTRADSGTTLDYDATMAFLKASEHLAKESLTHDQMQQALAGLTGSNALQGAAGQLAFGSDGNPINKAITIVCNKNGFFQLDVVVGQFLVNGPLLAEYPTKSVCAYETGPPKS